MRWNTKQNLGLALAFIAGIAVTSGFFWWRYSSPALYPGHDPIKPQAWFTKPAAAANSNRAEADSDNEDSADNAAMQAMLEHMRQEEARINKIFQDPFRAMPGAGGFGMGGFGLGGFGMENPTEISTHEDEKFLYYEIHSKSLDKNSVNVKIENGMIAITGELKQENTGKANGFSGKSMFVSRFQRSFPVPENVDPDRMQVDSSQDKVVLKFPKKPV